MPENKVLTEEWFDDYAATDDDFRIDEYDITATPNDFNVITIFNFIESGSVEIPGFQRNFVWDIGRASKLIESIILGLPIPQIFLYEKDRNRFLVIDGQQRLMSIYYFMKQRFPLKDKRVELRSIFDQHGHIPDNILHDDTYFSNFNLVLPERLPKQKSKFAGLNYSTLGEYKSQFELRPIRNVIVKQNEPKDDSSIYEIFSRLNSGGINLNAQEIRSSLYHSSFYDTLAQLNSKQEWRRLLQSEQPDLHLKDIEILLRAFAIMVEWKSYKPSLTRFLNQFSTKSREHTDEQNAYLANLFQSFLDAAKHLPPEAFLNKRNGKFNIALFEAAFAVTCEGPFAERQLVTAPLDQERLARLENDPDFLKAALEGTTATSNILTRLERARAILVTG
jgi:uncharacterized protein with ParB-like and HNH nuclease domain